MQCESWYVALMRESYNQSGLPEWLQVDESSLPYPPVAAPQTVAMLNVKFENMFERVIELVSTGRSFKSVVQGDPTIPSFEAFNRWMKKSPARMERFREAQEMASEIMASDILEIADGDSQSELPEEAARSRLRIDARKHLMASWNKRKYGDLKQLEVTGGISILDALQEARKRVIDVEAVDVDDESSSSQARLEAPPDRLQFIPQPSESSASWLARDETVIDQ